jgi:membrane-bound lytic murein transglycosylase D
MDEVALRELNRIPANMLVKAGSTLLVPRNGHRADVSEHVADHAMIVLAPESAPQRRVVFKAGKKGMTVAAVAARYGVSSAQIAQWNRVARNAHFAAGDSVVVFVPQRAAKSATQRRSSVKGKVRPRK